MKVSDLFLECLSKQGVKNICGVPGEENADIMISLLNSKIDFTTCRHEQTAAFMAAMNGYLTGIPGVCLATLGPGAANLVTAVGQANMDHYPLVAIIGQADTTRLHKVSHQNMDSIEMFRPHTKWATTIRDKESIPEIIAKAFKVATTGLPGAVVIELPEDIAKMFTESSPLEKINSTYYSGCSVQERDLVLDAIANANKVILLAGDGAVRCQLDNSLKEFMDKTNIYGATTFMGKGSISDNDKHSLHCVGMGMKDIAVTAFDEADVVICVGYDMVEWSPQKWNSAKNKKIIHINVEPSEVDAGYMPFIEIIGNMNESLKNINEKLSDSHIKNKNEFAALKKEIDADLSKYDNSYDFPMKPVRVLHDIRNVLENDDILISDVGAHKMWVARQYLTYKSKTCFISNGFCSMGGSMPSALEAKKLYPEKNVIALCGDGGFIMSIQALITAVNIKSPITVVVWVDNQYGLICWKQEMEFHKHSHIDLENPDLEMLAKSIGCHAHTINNTESFKSILKDSLSRKDKPSVIFVPIDYKENMKLFHHLENIVK